MLRRPPDGVGRQHTVQHISCARSCLPAYLYVQRSCSLPVLRFVADRLGPGGSTSRWCMCVLVLVLNVSVDVPHRAPVQVLAGADWL